MSEAPVKREGTVLLATVRAGSVVARNPAGFGFVIVHPDEAPIVVNAGGLRRLEFKA